MEDRAGEEGGEVSTNLEIILTPERGWLIEKDVTPPQWFTVFSWEGFDWTDNSLLAIRFARREDAERIALMMENDDIKITEHQWG